MRGRTQKIVLATMMVILIMVVACGVQATDPIGPTGAAGPTSSPAPSSGPTATSFSEPASPGTSRPSGANASTQRLTPTPHVPLTLNPVAPQEPVSTSTPIRTPLPAGTVSPNPTSTLASIPATQTTVVAACGSGPALTHPPMDNDAYLNIVPLGNLNPPSHTFPTGHMYFSLPFEQSGTNDGPFGNGQVFPAQNVYAAADARIASLALSNTVSTLSGQPEQYQEFDLHLEVCDGVRVRYGHIGPLSDRLLALVEQAEPNWCNSYATGFWDIERCEYSPGWEVEAGELIAYTSGRAAAFDFGATRPSEADSHTFVPECPLDLYDEQLRTSFEELLGTGNIQRTITPLCGVVDMDLPGTAQGRWFKTLEGHPVEDQNVALVFDNIDPAIPVFSIGNSVPGVQSNAYRFVPSTAGSVNRHFAAVTPGSGVFCYEGLEDRFGNEHPNTTFLIEMPDESTLRIEAVQSASCGSGPWTLSENATTFVR